MQVHRINDLHQFESLRAKMPLDQQSFLQSSEYGEMQKGLGNEPWYLTNGEKAWLFILFKAKRGTYLLCPYGIFTEAELKAVTDFLSTEGRKHHVDFLRFSPLMENTDANREMFKKAGFRDAPVHLMHPELVWLLDLNADEDSLLNGMRKNTRYYVRRAEKDGVSIKRGATQELLDEFYKIHAETAKRQKFVPYSKSFLDHQLEVFGPKGEIEVIVGVYQDKPIASAVIMYYGNEGVYHHGASLTEYNKIPASYLIQWEAIKEAKKRGKARYNFWGVVENAPKHPWAGLSFFKQGFGGQGQYLIHAQDYILGPKYWLNYAVEKYRKWRRGY